jgi:outer membrane protein OmpA-like peptidoglycan-associated protein
VKQFLAIVVAFSLCASGKAFAEEYSHYTYGTKKGSIEIDMGALTPPPQRPIVPPTEVNQTPLPQDDKKPISLVQPLQEQERIHLTPPPPKDEVSDAELLQDDDSIEWISPEELDAKTEPEPAPAPQKKRLMKPFFTARAIDIPTADSGIIWSNPLQEEIVPMKEAAAPLEETAAPVEEATPPPPKKKTPRVKRKRPAPQNIIQQAEPVVPAPENIAAPLSTPAPEPMAAAPMEQITEPVAPPAAASSGNIIFEANASALSTDARQALDTLAAQMKTTTNRLQIRAYASSPDGNKSTERRLSLSRGLAVRSYLAEKGISPTRLDVRALGSETGKMPKDRVDLTFPE